MDQIPTQIRVLVLVCCSEWYKHVLKVTGDTLSSKDLMLKLVQNIPRVLVYVPPQVNVRSQVSLVLHAPGGIQSRIWFRLGF